MNHEPVRPSNVMASPSSASRSTRAAAKFAGATGPSLASTSSNRRRVASEEQRVDLNQEREADRERGVPDPEGQRGAVRESQSRATVQRKISPIAAAVVLEMKRAAGLAEDRPVLAEPKVPLHHDRQPGIVARPIDTDAEAHAVVDRVDEAIGRQYDVPR